MIRVNDTLSSSSGELHPQPRLVTETCPIEGPPRARKSYEPAPRTSLDVITSCGLPRTFGAVSLGRQPTSLRPVCCGPVPPTAGRRLVRHTFTNRAILVRQTPSAHPEHDPRWRPTLPSSPLKLGARVRTNLEHFLWSPSCCDTKHGASSTAQWGTYQRGTTNYDCY